MIHKWDKSRSSNLFLSATAGLILSEKTSLLSLRMQICDREKSLFMMCFSSEALMSGCGGSYITEGDSILKKTL